jgi:hypothetical protein
MIHYPQDKADAMIAHLASLAEQRLIVSFAPKTPYYSVLKRIGELFPGPSKVSRWSWFECCGWGFNTLLHVIIWLLSSPYYSVLKRTGSSCQAHLR